MFTALVVVAVMAVVYGFAWHDQPAKVDEKDPRPNRKA